MTLIELALKMRPYIEQAAQSLDDQTASNAAALFPRLRQDGALVEAGTRINWGGTVKRAAVDLWDNEQSTPDTAPTLWEDLAYRDGYRIIPETITAGTAFALNECGWWGDALYRSIYNGANVWTPGQYPEAWERVHE